MKTYIHFRPIPSTLEELKAAKEAVRKALEDFAKRTGCHN